jgi:hypothetical protein
MIEENSIIHTLLEYVEVDGERVVCHFKCPQSDKRIVSAVAFEPYSGKIVITWKDILFHPIKSYKRYYHTPIVIFGNDTQHTIVMKAFKQVSTQFLWDEKEKTYRCK